MAFDGITIANIVNELNKTVLGGRINKISQPENDELILTIKGPEGNYKLLISASASLPLIYLTEQSKPNPMTAPNFCMLLRKYITNGRILSISQPDFERIIRFEISHLNELGDPCVKYLIVEIMGKHSNIIFTDDKDMILDSIKHVSASTSSIREVLPGRNYFIAKTQEKSDPLQTSKEDFQALVFSKATSVSKALYSSYNGLSPLAANEICERASIDGDMATAALNASEQLHLYRMFCMFFEEITEGNFCPFIYFDGEEPFEYSSFSYLSFKDKVAKEYKTISALLSDYYLKKQVYQRIRQKSVDLRKIVSTALERNRKKYDLQLKQLEDTNSKDKFKIYGELLHTYGYSCEPNAKALTCMNYYTNEEISIPLDPEKTAMENAAHYFEKYGKLKRTQEALTEYIVETKDEITHLESVSEALDIASSENDLAQIKEELILSGHIRGNNVQKKMKTKNLPLHYLSTDGYHIYVGKNNIQNEELTFQFANGGDWWFHAKGMAGSHVIVKTDGVSELPDRVFEEAGKLAGYYSKGKGSDKLEIDYVQRKFVKKPAGSKPGFVVYYTNYSLTTDTDISGITQIIDDK